MGIETGTTRSLAVQMLLVVAVFFVVGACGSDRGSGQKLRVVGTEMAFAAPERVSSGRYEVIFRNEGAVAHELALKDPAGEVVTRRSIAAGAEAVLEIDLGPGTWELGCFEPGHYEAGMHRLLEVES